MQAFGMVQSMSRKGNCTDNAPIESFFGHMKDELEYQHCKTLDELRRIIDAYMRYYNCERKQWQRKKMTPVAYRNHLLSAARAA
jgi:transposase InsO family protein